jgi:pimeloyl-ACP methyl ester carboxylesterase
MGKLTKPKSYDRFLIQAEACRNHDSYDLLGSVTAPTLVMGGELDKCLGGEASREIAGKIPGAVLKMYQQWGHGLYEEAEDFQDVILEFLRR